MKPVNFKPEGRKLTEFQWVSESTVYDTQGRKSRGPKATVVIRYVETTATFNGRVDDTTVYAEGDSVKAVRDACFDQLAAMHAVTWTEKLWVRLIPDELYGGHRTGLTAFSAVRVRLSETPHGKIWQRFGRRDENHGDAGGTWLTTRLGEPPVGLVEEGAYSPQTVIAVLVEPSLKVELAVAALSKQWNSILERAAKGFAELFKEGAAGVEKIVGQGDSLVLRLLADATVDVTRDG